MAFADLHCDTLSALQGRPLRDGEGLHINLEKLRKGGYLLQNFALFVHTPEVAGSPWERAIELAELFWREMEKNRDFVLPVKTVADLERAKREGKLGAVLTGEEGAMFEGDLSKLRTLHRLGMRMATLTWNYENNLAFPNGKLGGLKEKGYEFLAEMERLGILVDVSHLGDKGFWDVVRTAKRPFCASHSSCRALWNHPRNLTDEMLKAVADAGGIVGINFYAGFLGESPMSRREDLVRHICHGVRVAGAEAIALGSDFDGIHCPLELGDAAGMPSLIPVLEKAGLTEREIERVTWKNVWAFYHRML